MLDTMLAMLDTNTLGIGTNTNEVSLNSFTKHNNQLDHVFY